MEADFEALTSSDAATFVEAWNRAKPSVIQFGKRTIKPDDEVGRALIDQAEAASTDWGTFYLIFVSYNSILFKCMP